MVNLKRIYLAEFHTIGGELIYQKIVTLMATVTDRLKQEFEENIKKIMGGSEMENKMVKIEEKEMMLKEWKGERVVTSWDIANLHKKEVKVVNQQFSNNEKYFLKDVDFFEITKEEFAVNNIDRGINTNAINASKTIKLFTESGYLMLVKTFTDDLSWQIQRQLVNVYFKARTAVAKVEAVQTQPDTTEILNYMMKEILQLKKAVKELRHEESPQKPLFDIADMSSPRTIFVKTVKQITIEKKCPLQYSEIYDRLEKDTGKKYREEASKAGLLVIDYIEEIGDIDKAIKIAKQML